MNSRFLAVAAVALLCCACSQTPLTTPLLDQARGDYVAATNNALIATYASSEFKQAGDALEQANSAAARNESLAKVDQLAYVARQNIASARETAKGRAAEADVASAGRQRDQIQLAQRTTEADRAKQEADRAKLEAERAKSDAEQSKAMANQAQRDADAARAQAASLEAQLADLAAKKTERGLVITFGDVLFATDEARLLPGGMANLHKLADVLRQHPERRVTVEGFTDSTGTPAHNQALSERRADAVRAALQQEGIDPGRVLIHGYGPEYPVASNATAAGRQLNRRVEIVLSDENGRVPPRT
jgi:outer membrane protein OmpA-like peptidoglycan-associated protein